MSEGSQCSCVHITQHDRPIFSLKVSVVQPVSGVGLVGLAVYSHLFLRVGPGWRGCMKGCFVAAGGGCTHAAASIPTHVFLT